MPKNKVQFQNDAIYRVHTAARNRGIIPVTVGAQ